LESYEQDGEDGEDEPGKTFPQLLPLLKARLELLPRPSRPLPPHKEPERSSLSEIQLILREEGEKLEYAYDFGDGWELLIKLEKVLPPEPGHVPRCTAGRREAPPEDSGGIWVYEQDGPFGIDVFDRDEVNDTLRQRFGDG